MNASYILIACLLGTPCNRKRSLGNRRPDRIVEELSAQRPADGLGLFSCGVTQDDLADRKKAASLVQSGTGALPAIETALDKLDRESAESDLSPFS